MKKLLTLVAAFAATILSANAQYNYGSSYGTSTYGTNPNSTYVSGYTKSNGTYVQGHYRSTRNSTNHDNWSTTGNTNIYPGTSGSRQKTPQPELTTMVVDTLSIPAHAADNTTSTVTATRHTSPNVDNH